MIARLEKDDPIITDQIDDAMLLRQPPRPEAGRKVLQRFRLADPGERVA